MAKIHEITEAMRRCRVIIGKIAVPMMLAIGVVYMGNNLVESIFLIGITRGVFGLYSLDNQMTYCMNYSPIILVVGSLVLGFLLDFLFLRNSYPGPFRHRYWISLIFVIIVRAAGYFLTLALVGPVEPEIFETARYLICY